MIAYGLDLSMSCSGVTVFDYTNKKLEPILTMSIKTKDNQKHPQRLKTIADYFLELKNRYPPEIIVIERGFGRFNNSTQAIFKTHGVVNYIFYDVEQIYYPPKTVKEAIARGDATKLYIQKMLLVAYPEVQFNNNDESDSFAVGLTYFIKNNLIEWNKEELKKELRVRRKYERK